MNSISARRAPLALALTALALPLIPCPARAVIISSGDVKPPFNLPDIPGPRNFTVPINGSTAGGVIVGDLDPGALTINNGWTLNSTFCSIARTATAANASFGPSSVTISDNSAWNLSGGMLVGVGALGLLNVLTGSSVSAEAMVLGFDPGVVGQANFTSSTLTTVGGLIAGLSGTGNFQLDGSEATVGFLEVGRSGSGFFNVTNGASLTTTGAATAIVFATEATAIATGFISGPPTVVNNDGFLEVGRNGDATVTISAGASVTSDTFAIIATESASTSTLNVTGSGTMWSTGAGVEVGRNGDATLTIQAGAQAESDFAIVSIGANSDSSVTVTGPGSRWTNTASLGIGRFGQATLLIQNGGVVAALNSAAGLEPGSRGDITVTGANSRWEHAGPLSLATGGTATLLIENGGAVTSDFALFAEDPSGNGSAIIRGTGSSWTNGAFDIGFDGMGSLTLENGATISSSFVRLGAEATASGTVIVRNSATWTSSSSFEIARRGVGVLTLESGASISSTGVIIGTEAGANGEVALHGPFTAWTAGGLEVGRTGEGTFLQDNGATFTNNGFFSIASLGGTGEATITGAGTSFTSTSQLIAGGEGTGTLIVSGGALLTTFKAASATGTSGLIGRRAGGGGMVRGVGMVTVTGAGSRYLGDGVLNVGFDGDGTLAIEAGGRVESTDGIIGRNATAIGHVTIGGSSSAWVMANGLEIGRAGRGTLTMNGGSLTASQLTLGVNGTAYGELDLGGGIIETAFLSGGAGLLVLTFDGGTLRASEDEADFIRSASFNATNTQILSGGLTIDTNGHAVTLLNSMDGPGALTKTGAGTLDLDGGTQTFAALNANAGTTNVDVGLGSGTTVNVNALVNFGASQTLAGLAISNDGVATLSPSALGPLAVPEPGAWSLLACGVAALLSRRRQL